MTDKEMFAAAERGDAAALKQLIAAGAPVDPRDATGQTPLLLAVARDRLDAAIALIEAGAGRKAGLLYQR
ncbi:MAG: ankyrin repeat domain-containing protein [Alphaproteobacteria bacterium]|nr:ankyrin repeat domain-containing protein [Alphaproteobacteria bacterium]